MKLRLQWVMLGFVVLVGAAVRFPSIGYGLPFTYRPDEPTFAAIVLKMLKTGDLNPHWFGYPGLMFYVNAVVLAVFNFFFPLQYPEVITMGVGYLETPALFLITRGVTALFSTGAIGMTYLVARCLHLRAGLVAAVMVAISPAIVSTSFAFTPDAYALFFLLVSIWGTLLVIKDPCVRNYLVAGLFAGLAASAKYNAGLILLTLVSAHFWRFGVRGLARKQIYAAGLVTAFGFLLTNPFALLDWYAFWQGMVIGPRQYIVEGHAGQEGNSLQWYISYLQSFEGWYVVLAIVTMTIAFIRKRPAEIILAIFSLIYFIAIAQLRIRNERTIALIVPLLAIFASVLLVRIRTYVAKSPTRLIAFGLVTIIMIFQPLWMTLAMNQKIVQPSLRETVRQWLEANLPENSRIVVEAYSPYMDTRRWRLFGIDSIADRPVGWYAENGFEYIVFSKDMFGRFYFDPLAYSDVIAKYDALFRRYPELKRWESNGEEIRLAKTDVALPSHRTAIRFGDYGELIELVGYEDSVWKAGEPLRVKMTWRALGETAEPFEVELRLLDKDDRQIAIVRDDLFQGRGWRAGMFTNEWVLKIPADVPPGSDRLQVSVIWTRFNYRLPAMTWTGADISPVLLGPFEPE